MGRGLSLGHEASVYGDRSDLWMACEPQRLKRADAGLMPIVRSKRVTAGGSEFKGDRVSPDAKL